MTAAGGRLWFAADDGTIGEEPYSSDGTLSGTTLVGDLNPGAGSSNAGGFVHLGGLCGVLFGADDGSYGAEPWIFGPGGARMIFDLQPGPVGSFDAGTPHFAFHNGTYLFAADDGAAGIELAHAQRFDLVAPNCRTLNLNRLPSLGLGTR